MCSSDLAGAAEVAAGAEIGGGAAVDCAVAVPVTHNSAMALPHQGNVISSRKFIMASSIFFDFDENNR